MPSLVTSETLKTFPYKKFGKNLDQFKPAKEKYKLENDHIRELKSFGDIPWN